MIGTIANASTILVGSIIGSTLRKGFDEKYKNIMMDSKCTRVRSLIGMLMKWDQSVMY